MNTSVSIESSNTNEEVNLQIIPYMTETIEEEVIIEMDTSMSDSTLEVSSDSEEVIIE
jgi:putative aminopeptidase FrvX